MEKHYILKNSQFTLPNAPCVIPFSAYEELVLANGIIQTAKDKAKEIEENAKALYEKERVRGYDDGMMESKSVIADQMLDLISERVNYLESMEIELIQIVMNSLNKILEEIPAEEKIISTVKRALSYVRSQKKVTLRISPEDESFVQNALASLHSFVPSIQILDIYPDKRLSVGECILESDLGIMDASLATQLKSIERAFMKNHATKG